MYIGNIPVDASKIIQVKKMYHAYAESHYFYVQIVFATPVTLNKKEHILINVFERYEKKKFFNLLYHIRQTREDRISYVEEYLIRNKYFKRA
ncbi:MAG: hypothetical protein V1904_09650 [Bacteroidota bacterium]